MARIAVGGFHHETNTFVPTVTDFAYFCVQRDRPPLVRGPDVLAWMPKAAYPLSAFMDYFGSRHEWVPLVWTSGGAGGMVTRDAFERVAAEMVGLLSQQMPVDAIYLDLHGAMVSEDYQDGEGELLRRIRAAVGPDMPIVISLDYHSNVTPQMTALADAIQVFRTYPHVDRKDTGERAARAMERILAEGRPKGRALRKLPFLIPLHAQCTMVDPSRAIVAEAVRLEHAGILSLSYLAGFPPSDIYYCGPSVVVHARTQAEADDAADALARFIALREPDFAEPLFTPEAAVAQAMDLAATATRPVVLADTQDNPGAGGSSDTTGLLAALVKLGAQGAVLGHLYDAEAAAAAHKAGEGSDITLALGGRHGPDGVEPFRATFRVKKLGSGKFRTTGPVAGGRDVDFGPMALLSIGGVDISVTPKRVQAHDQAPFRHLGVEPAAQKILALKSSVHFRGDFEPVAEKVLVVVAPGQHLADSTRYPFRNLRPGIRLTTLGPESAGPQGQPWRAP